MLGSSLLPSEASEGDDAQATGSPQKSPRKRVKPSEEPSVWQRMIKEMDLNGDGKISFEEFEHFMKKMLEDLP